MNHSTAEYLSFPKIRFSPTGQERKQIQRMMIHVFSLREFEESLEPQISLEQYAKVSAIFEDIIEAAIQTGNFTFWPQLEYCGSKFRIKNLLFLRELAQKSLQPEFVCACAAHRIEIAASLRQMKNGEKECVLKFWV